jgi:adenylate kinase
MPKAADGSGLGGARGNALPPNRTLSELDPKFIIILLREPLSSSQRRYEKKNKDKKYFGAL